jgi:hypothetical protein
MSRGSKKHGINERFSVVFDTLCVFLIQIRLFSFHLILLIVLTFLFLSLIRGFFKDKLEFDGKFWQMLKTVSDM